MKKRIRTLHVLMNGILIGKLEKTTQGLLSFAYDRQWLNTPGARPISLSLPLIDHVFTGDIVYHFFDNLLPDNLQIRARIQSTFQIPTSQPFDLLASIGRDCVGAIQIIEREPAPFQHQINCEPLITKHQLQAQKIKMAMALTGKNTQYHWHATQRRHFINTAKSAHYSTEKAEDILNNMLSQVDAVIEKTQARLPQDFPEHLSDAVFQGMQKMKKRLQA